MTERTKESCNTIMQKVLSNWEQDTHFRDLNRPKSRDLATWVHDRVMLDTKLAGFNFYDIYDRFCAKPSEKDSSLLSIYENLSKYNAEIRLIGKPGKIIKRIFPYMNPQEVEAFVTWYKETFVQNSLGYKVKSGKESADFKLAYAGNQSPATDCDYYGGIVKSLSGSCMRHGFEDLTCHPAEVYASGDFTIYWVEDSEGRIAARCVVYNKTDTINKAGPIYTNTNLATNTLKDHLELLGITDFDCSFDGAKIKRVSKSSYSDSYVIPFVDGCGYAEEYNDDFWVLTSDKPSGEYLEGQTCGYSELSSGGESCANCSDTTDEDDLTYIDNVGSICPHCLANDYTQCADDGGYYPNSEVTEVYYYRRGYAQSNYYRTDWAESNAVYCENEDEYWHSDDTIYVECEDIYVPTKVANDYYFQSTVDGEYYLDTEKVETELGDMTKDQAIEAGLTLVGDSWIKCPEAYTVETIVTERQRYNETIEETKTNLILRDNFQLDDSGKPQRNPDLFDTVNKTSENAGL